MKKLNNKGYLLVEIVLASAIAFGLATFLITLVIRVKNKNQDLMVENEIEVDRGIIANMIMKNVNENGYKNCDTIISNISIEGNKFTYPKTNGKSVYLSKYTVIDSNNIKCKVDVNNCNDCSVLTIPIKDTIGNKNYDIKLYFTDKIE